MDFAPLHCRSHYSLLRATGTPAQLVAACAKQGWATAALTDHHSVAGAMEFFHACRDHGVRPILGATVQVQLAFGLVGEVVLLAQGQAGYSQLCRLLSSETPLSWRRFEEQNEHLVLLTGGAQGLLRVLSAQQGGQAAQAFLQKAATIWGQRCVVELAERKAEDRVWLRRWAQWASDLELLTVVTPDSYYVEPEQKKQWQSVMSMRTLTLLDQEHEEKLGAGEFHLFENTELKERFSWHPEGLENSVRVASWCETVPIYGWEPS
ncbi:MAG: PHP domain-containing protein [Verrucomicrobiales bacterium]